MKQGKKKKKLLQGQPLMGKKKKSPRKAAKTLTLEVSKILLDKTLSNLV